MKRALAEYTARGSLSILPPPAVWSALVFLGVFFFVPVVRVLARSFFDPGLTLTHYRHLFLVPLYNAYLVRTFEIAFTVALVCLLLAYPTAYFLVTVPPRSGKVLIAFVMLPFFMSILVRSYAWIFLLGSHGVINSALLRSGIINAPLPLMFNRFGVVVGMVHVLLPYMILILLSVMQTIDRRLPMAAGSLLAPPFTSFRRVFVPLSLPGVGAGFLLVFVLALAFFITPAMLGGVRDQMMANLVADATGSLDWGFAAALSMLLVTATAIAVLSTQWLFGGISLLAPGAEPQGRRIRARRTHEGRLVGAIDASLNGIWPYIPPILGGAVLAFLVVPVLFIVPLSLSSVPYFVFPPPGFSWQWYLEYFTNPDWLEATRHSFEIALLTMCLATTMAVPAALGIARWRSRFNTVVYIGILAPLIVPGIVVAIGAFYVLSGFRLTDTIWGVSLGHTIVALPLVTVVLAAALRNFDFNLERASISLGASPFRTVRLVTLPVLSTAILTAAFFAFLHSFDELLVALFVSGIEARTLPKMLWQSLEEVDPTIAAVSTLLILFTISVLTALRLIEGAGVRRRGASPRTDALTLSPRIGGSQK